MFDCNALLLRYFLANKLPIFHDGFLYNVSSFPFLLKQGLDQCRFLMSMSSHVWKISALIPLSNFSKKFPLGVHPLGTWNNHQWQQICIHLLEMGHICPHINIPMGATVCISGVVARIMMKGFLLDWTDIFLSNLQHRYSFWATRRIHVSCV